LQIFEVRYLDLIKQCQREQRPFGVVMLHQGREVQQAGVMESPGTWGCVAHLLEVEQIQPALLRVTCRGGQRFQLMESQRGAYGRWRGQAQLSDPDPVVAIPPVLQPLADRLGQLIADAQRRGSSCRWPCRSRSTCWPQTTHSSAWNWWRKWSRARWGMRQAMGVQTPTAGKIRPQ
jgi:hypothetical protein